MRMHDSFETISKNVTNTKGKVIFELFILGFYVYKNVRYIRILIRKKGVI